MADQIKDQRIITLMTPSELEAIDDWGFKRRIRSRGEAIRRLCVLGITSSDRTGKILKALRQNAAELSAATATAEKLAKGLGEKDREAIIDVAAVGLMTNRRFAAAIAPLILQSLSVSADGEEDEIIDFMKTIKVTFEDLFKDDKAAVRFLLDALEALPEPDGE